MVSPSSQQPPPPPTAMPLPLPPPSLPKHAPPSIPPHPPSIRDTGRNALRRPHRKSRLGCANCKTRRVKCDEARPACGFCTIRQLPCQYPEAIVQQPGLPALAPTSSPESTAVVAAPRSRTYGPGPSSGGPSPPSTSTDAARPTLLPPITTTTSGPASDISVAMAAVAVASGPLPLPTALPGPAHVSSINFDHSELLLNYTSSTVNSMSRYGHIVDLWREDVPKLALEYPFLMHAVMALSSIQLARFAHVATARRSSDFYKNQATHHYCESLRIAGPLMAPNEDNCHAMYVYVILSFFHALAMGPRPGSYLFLGDDRVNKDAALEWSLGFRACVPIGQPNWQRLLSGPVGALAALTDKCLGILNSVRAEHEAEPFRRLREHIEDSEQHDPERRALYLDAVRGVSRCYSAIYDDRGFPSKHARDLGWYSSIALTNDTRFLALLQARVPNALIICAYNTVVFKDADFGWFTDGWPQHIISAIHDWLDPAYRVHISWPIKKIGWAPPG